MCVHDVERHLHGVEFEVVFGSNLKHVQMYARVFVPCEAYKTEFACLTRFDECGGCALFIKDSMRVFITQDFMMLNQVYRVHLQPLQRFVQLFGGLFFCVSSVGVTVPRFLASTGVPSLPPGSIKSPLTMSS